MKTKIALLCLALSAPALAQAPATAPTAAPGSAPAAAAPAFVAAGAFFALVVPDARASAKWYSDKLGLKMVMDVPKRDGVSVIVLEGGGLIVELLQNEQAVPLSKVVPEQSHVALHGMTKAGVIVTDLDKTLAALKGRGVAVAYGPYPAKDDQRANFIIKDGDGNLIQFFGAQAR
jgi:catechol 2,3-dioxygenase-like lactoylglutathione lyase family enzyme